MIVVNKNGFDWVNVTMHINPGLISGGWEAKCARIPAGGTFTIGIMQFTSGDGERFNPFTHKIEHFVLSCETRPDHGLGSWEGEFN